MFARFIDNVGTVSDPSVNGFQLISSEWFVDDSDDWFTFDGDADHGCDIVE